LDHRSTVTGTAKPAKPGSHPCARCRHDGAVYERFADAITRILRYARLTADALREYKDGTSYLEGIKELTDLEAESMRKLVLAANRKIDIEWLKAEKENADGLICGQATISMWGTLEAFVDDLIPAVLLVDPSRVDTEDAFQAVEAACVHRRVIEARPGQGRTAKVARDQLGAGEVCPGEIRVAKTRTTTSGDRRDGSLQQRVLGLELRGAVGHEHRSDCDGRSSRATSRGGRCEATRKRD
jgi:hypothetical protein